MLTTILLVILILMLVGALPTWGYSSGWGYGPGESSACSSSSHRSCINRTNLIRRPYRASRQRNYTALYWQSGPHQALSRGLAVGTLFIIAD